MICAISCISFASATTTYLAKTENGHVYKVMKVALDGKSKIVVSAVASSMPAQSLQTLMENAGGTQAINGAYFCPDEAAYSWCVGNTTDTLRKANGQLYSKRSKDIGMYKSLFGFAADGTPITVANDGTYKEDPNVDIVENGIAMPTLVKDGINVAVLNNEMNNDAKQSKIGNKTFICSTKDNSVIYMWYVDGVTFSSIADYIIETFNCYNAIQLDNGWSKAMINDGKYVAGPWRNIMDAFVVIEGDAVWTKVVTGDSANEVDTATTEELKTAVDWMYTAGLTSKATLADFLPNKTMTRQEASKFFSVFAKSEFNKTEKASDTCAFSDMRLSDTTLTTSITSACKLGIFKWYKGNFDPRAKLDNAQAITVLIRIMVGMLTEPTNKYYTNYILKAKEFGLIGEVNVKNAITRGEAAILLYKAHLYREEIEGVTAQNHDEDTPVTDTGIVGPTTWTVDTSKEPRDYYFNMKSFCDYNYYTNHIYVASCKNSYSPDFRTRTDFGLTAEEAKTMSDEELEQWESSH